MSCCNQALTRFANNLKGIAHPWTLQIKTRPEQKQSLLRVSRRERAAHKQQPLQRKQGTHHRTSNSKSTDKSFPQLPVLGMIQNHNAPPEMPSLIGKTSCLIPENDWESK